MKLCKLTEATTTTTAAIPPFRIPGCRFVLQIVTVASTKLTISGKKNMIPMVVFILVGISMNLVRAENNQYRQPHRYQNNRQQSTSSSSQQQQQPSTDKLRPNLSDIDDSAYYYECVPYQVSNKKQTKNYKQNWNSIIRFKMTFSNQKKLTLHRKHSQILMKKNVSMLATLNKAFWNLIYFDWSIHFDFDFFFSWKHLHILSVFCEIPFPRLNGLSVYFGLRSQNKKKKKWRISSWCGIQNH